jgi:hypothetical protein
LTSLARRVGDVGKGAGRGRACSTRLARRVSETPNSSSRVSTDVPTCPLPPAQGSLPAIARSPAQPWGPSGVGAARGLGDGAESLTVGRAVGRKHIVGREGRGMTRDLDDDAFGLWDVLARELLARAVALELHLLARGRDGVHRHWRVRRRPHGHWRPPCHTCRARSPSRVMGSREA